MEMDHFNSLPDEIIAEIFQLFLAVDVNCLSKYNRLHMVCRRWYAICLNWTKHFPKGNRWFELRIENDGCVITPPTGYLKCTNYDGKGDGPKLTDMFRHFDTTDRMTELIFDLEKMMCINALLIQLIEKNLTHCKRLVFEDCDMSGVTEDVLTSFFASVAVSNCCTHLQIGKVKSAEAVFTDRSLEPIMSNGRADFFRMSMRSKAPTVLGITDSTLATFVNHFPQPEFEIELSSSAKYITAQDVHKFIGFIIHVTMDFFSSLPEEMVANIFRYVLTENEEVRLAKFRQLHLVCRQWHAVCANWAEHLPKSTRRFGLHIDNEGCTIAHIPALKCTNFDGSGCGPKLVDLLRHYNTAEKHQLLLFCSLLVCTDTLLLQLIECQVIQCRLLSFKDCDLSAVTENVMTEFFAAVADSKCCKSLTICNAASTEGVITDRSLAPIANSGQLAYLEITPSYATGVTDETLNNLAKHFSSELPMFNFRFGNLQQITAQGVLRLIEAYCSPASPIKQSSSLDIPLRLKFELLKLRGPNKIEVRKLGGAIWNFTRSPRHPFPGRVSVTFADPIVIVQIGLLG